MGTASVRSGRRSKSTTGFAPRAISWAFQPRRIASSSSRRGWATLDLPSQRQRLVGVEVVPGERHGDVGPLVVPEDVVGCDHLRPVRHLLDGAAPQQRSLLMADADGEMAGGTGDGLSPEELIEEAPASAAVL